MQQPHTLMQQQYLKISSCALQQNQKDRIPDDYERIQTLLVAIYASYSAIYERMLTLIDNRELNIGNMTYEVFLRLVFDAETRPRSRSAIIAFTLSLFNKKSAQDPRPKPLTKDSPSKDGDL